MEWQGLPPFLGCLGDTQFSFRIRQCGGQRSPRTTDDRLYNSEAPLSLQVSGLPLQPLCHLCPRAGEGWYGSPFKVPGPCAAEEALASPSLSGVGQLFWGLPRAPGELFLCTMHAAGCGLVCRGLHGGSGVPGPWAAPHCVCGDEMLPLEVFPTF